MKTLKGIGASAGISGVAKTFVIKEEELEITQSTIENTEEEIAKFKNAVSTAAEQIKTLKENAVEKLGEEEAQIFDAHLQIALDPAFEDQISQKIETEKVNAI
jgi:phosphotransferase system enzyme I (PtsI)